MSRSRKKEPYYSCKPGSFKAWKKEINSMHRSRCKQTLGTCEDWDALLMPDRDKEHSLWDSPKESRGWRVDEPEDNYCWKNYGTRKYFILKPGEHISWCNCKSNPNNGYLKVLRK